MMVGYRHIFRDRREAGQWLSDRLGHLASSDPLVLALPRGGVPVAFEVARALDADLDLLFVRKLGAPGYEELGIGAVVDGADPQLVLNEEVVRQLAPSPNYVRSEMQRQLAEIERRRHAYLGNRAPMPVDGRTVILVDDGIATGGTVKAALKGLRKAHAGRIILAVPVAPASSVAELRGECDELICLAQPDPFFAVGAHYVAFDQTSDEEVVRLLDDAREARRQRSHHANAQHEG
jgi:putative phosphoribosyl transferase